MHHLSLAVNLKMWQHTSVTQMFNRSNPHRTGPIGAWARLILNALQVHSNVHVGFSLWIEQ